MSRLYTGTDIDTDHLAQELRTLADEIEDGDAPVYRVGVTDSAKADDVATRSIQVGFQITEDISDDRCQLVFEEDADGD